MDQLKHVVNKPLRYQTTSSDESPTKRRRSIITTIGSGMIDENIEDINTILNEDSILDNNTYMAHPHTKIYTTTHARKYTDTHKHFSHRIHSRITDKYNTRTYFTDYTSTPTQYTRFYTYHKCT